MNIRQKLNRYIPLMREIKYLENKIANLRDRQTSIRSSSDASETQACSGNSDKIGNSIAELVDLENLYKSKIDIAIKELREIEYIIDVLTPTERLLIRAKYIDGEQLEAICGIIGYCYRQTKRIHGKALAKLESEYNQKLSPNVP